jgi:hypothetical protein
LRFRGFQVAAARGMWFLCGFESCLPLTQLNALSQQRRERSVRRHRQGCRPIGFEVRGRIVR